MLHNVPDFYVAQINAVLQLGYQVHVTFHSAWQEMDEIIKESYDCEVQIQSNDLIGTLRAISKVEHSDWILDC